MAKVLSTSKWKTARKKWVIQNPVTEFSEEGDTGWLCAFCGVPVWKDQLSLDHILRVQDYPMLKYDVHNLRPMHQTCNSNLDAIWRTEKGRTTFVRRKKAERSHKIRCVNETQEWYELAISTGAIPYTANKSLL